jgi:hypothetical protein
MNVDLAKLLEQLFADIFRSGQTLTAVQIQDATVAAGFSPSELDQVDWQQVYDNACDYPGVPAAYKGALQSPPNSPPPTVHTVVQEVQAIQQITNNNINIVDQSTNIDNSVDFGDADFSDFNGDISFDNDTAVAGDGGNANTGSQNGVAVGDGAAASGTGDAVAAGDGNFINLGTNVNTGNQVVGDENATVGGTTLDFGFGRGEAQPVTLREVEGGGIPGVPGDVGDINLQTGDNSAQDNSETFQQNQTNGDNSPINNESGEGGQNLDQQINQTFDAPELPRFEAEEFEPVHVASQAAADPDPADAI